MTTSIDDKIELLGKVLALTSWKNLTDELCEAHARLVDIFDEELIHEETRKFFYEEWPKTWFRYCKKGYISQDTIEALYYLALLQGLHHKAIEAEQNGTQFDLSGE
jgi:hypothetical protein